jgi:hypothetical protein
MASGSNTTRPASTSTGIDAAAIRKMVVDRLGTAPFPARFHIHTDTTDFFRVDYNDVVVLNGVPYLIRNCEREGRFGLDDEPKYWVKRAVDLKDGSTKIIKMVFHEQLTAHVGDLVFECVRSPRKEAEVLDLVRGRKHFMQGFAVTDAAGNIIRVLNYIRGRRLDTHVFEINKTHEHYYFTDVSVLLKNYIELVRAIGFLHKNGYKHGDIRRDHVLIDERTGAYTWIDFDFDYRHDSNMYGYDLFGLGNILIFLVGGGDVTLQYLKSEDSPALKSLNRDDQNIIYNNRIANLRKVYPYINDSLNYILLHFANGANLFYENTEQLLDDLSEVNIG